MLNRLRRAGAGTILGTLFALSVAAGCSTPAGEGFAIYLTKNDVPPSQMEMLSHVDIADEPIISTDDVVSYNSATHEMLLTDEAFARLAELEVPVQGRSFLVCVDRGPVYWGAFWVAYSSQSFDGITIWKPLGVEGNTVVALELGYPSPSFHQGEDPRSSPAVMAALDEAGKLFVPPPEEGPLPHSFKGYELYSWQEDGEWRFALLTGTNRNKTAEEVLSEESAVTGEGWVHIHATGVDEISALLSRIPEGEYVSWLTGPSGQSGDGFSLPPEPIVQAVRDHALACGLDIFVPAP
jgi:hypothetical protein